MNAIVPANIQVPAHLQSRLGKPSAMAAALMSGLSAGGYPRISIRGARFRLVDGETETVLPTLSLETVIVGANPRLSKFFYEGAYDPDAKDTKPTCFSLNGITPDAQAAAPQCENCAQCPMNAWGSKITPAGKQSKACSDNKRLAVVSADDPEGPIYLLTVTPAALKNLASYQKELAVRGIPPEVVKTVVEFDTNAQFPLLTFRFGGFLDETTQAAVDALFGSDAVKEITGEVETVAADAIASIPAKVVAAPVKPASTAPEKPVTRVAAAPVAVTPAGDDEQDTAPEPAAAPKRGFAAAAAAAPAAAPKKPAAKPRVVKPAAAPKVAEATDSLADEVLDLLGGMTDD